MANSNMNIRPLSNAHPAETEPLLGQPGDVTQSDFEGFQWNIITGTAAVAQGGIWVLTAIVWAAVFEHDLIYFSIHPLVNSAGILLLTQAILLLQPTITPKQKVRGTYIHSGFNVLALGCFIAGLTVIEINKGPHPENKFKSVHAKLGITTYVLIFLQFTVGLVQFYLPSLVGGRDNGKKIYRYHRALGYAILVLALVTVCFATLTGYNKNTLHIKTWSVITTSVLVVVGIFPRIKKAKFGL